MRNYNYITIFVLPTSEDSFVLNPIRYYGDDNNDYDFDYSQEYKGLDLALSNAVSQARLYESQHPNASICVIDNRGSDYDWRGASQVKQ